VVASCWMSTCLIFFLADVFPASFLVFSHFKLEVF
jgi:hypothetical protein